MESNLPRKSVGRVCVYHPAGGGGGEEEDELFDEGRLRDVAVLDDGDGRVADGANTLRRLQRESTGQCCQRGEE